ncbi:MAG: ion transporter [Opitutaceae bacterium]|jgi:voltage-gated potassium channel|nr:ion transporter [Opitutaceae bacterium]
MEDLSERAKAHQGDSLKERIWRTIFLSASGGARTFDIVLLILIAMSVVVVMLESVESVAAQYATLLHGLEWAFTILFTVEYAMRIWVVRRKKKYIFSFFGIVDLLSILPTYIDFILAGSGHFIIVRILRMLRMFRILKMAEHMGDAHVLMNALKASRSKIGVFIFSLMAIVCIEGTLMYIIEGGVEGTGFTSIPQAVYWGIVTVTTVGYGDIAPVTILGKMLASVMMLTGFAIIAVPTGIVSAELNRKNQEVSMDGRRCSGCGHDGHDPKALHCKMCGHAL